MPTTCNYYVTLRCNQRCDFCNIPHTNNGSPSREPTMEQVKSNLKDLRRLGVMVLDVTGGEPLLYRNVVEMLTLAKKMRLMTTVTTNGMLYPKFAEQLVGKVDALLFSIDSTDPATHDRVRGVKSFEHALEALATARRLRQPLYISHVVTNEAFPYVDEMVRFAKDQRAILYLNPCFSFFGNEGIRPEYAEQLRAYFGRAGVIVDPAQLALITQGGNDVKDPVCRAVSSTVVIGPENQLWLPCYHFKNDAITIRNDLYDLYTRDETVQFAKKNEGRHAFCQGCTVYCYMRSSLFWKYPVESFLLGAHYVRERARQTLTGWVSPPTGEKIPVPPVVRPAPIPEQPVVAAPAPVAKEPRAKPARSLPIIA